MTLNRLDSTGGKTVMLREIMARLSTKTVSLRQLAIGLGGFFLVWVVISALLLPGRPEAKSVNEVYFGRSIAPSANLAKSVMPAERFPARAPADASDRTSLAVASRTGGPNMAEDVLQNAADGGAIAKSARADRRIIYTATLELVTEDLNGVEPKLTELVKAAHGFVAETTQSGSSGGQRTATWRVRVPVDDYDGFLQKARSLGEVQSVSVNSQDVTEEFVDVTARVSAKKVQEQRLIDLIKNATGKLDEVLKVENELARVRGEIERMEGRIRYLKDQTELTTITITVKEVKDYRPPEAPTFGTKIRRTWQDSTERLSRETGDRVLGLIAWGPYLPIYAVLWGGGLWILWRAWRKIQPHLGASLSLTPTTPTVSPEASPNPPTEGPDDART